MEPTEPPQASPQTKASSGKVVILFKAVGDAPILATSIVKVAEQDRFSKILQFLRKQLDREQVFAYIKQAFCPSPDERIHVLHKAYSVDGKLVISYACTPAWG